MLAKRNADFILKQPDDSNGYRILRRAFLGSALLAAAAAALRGSPILRGVSAIAETSTTDVLRDTLNGLIAFLVPGPDAYSVAQGVSTAEQGGLDAGITDILVQSIDESAPYVPQFSAVVASILNDLAQAVNPSANGNFVSPFARLAFAEKVQVFRMMDETESLKPLAGVLPVFVGFLSYSEASVLDPATRALSGQPVGWDISHYDGVADGRDEFLGYFQNRRSAG